jgi:hypothetical protein
MSKGAGRVERVIAAAFANAAPMEVLTTEGLARLVYGVEQVEKKHRVAVLRAVKKMDIAIPVDGLRGMASPTDWIEIRNAANWTYGALEGYCGSRWERRGDCDERHRRLLDSSGQAGSPRTPQRA